MSERDNSRWIVAGFVALVIGITLGFREHREQIRDLQRRIAVLEQR